MKINRALISVFDKQGLEPFAQALHENGVEILSTGGTARVLRQAGIPLIDVSEYTQFPEIMDGRVKTINPLVEGGILGLRDQHGEEAEANGIKWIDLVVCNLYPFAETIQKPDVTLARALENIDIGGPTMIRSAAKNTGWVGVIVDPADYNTVVSELTDQKGLTIETRRILSAKAFGHTAQYDTLIHNYLKDEPLSDDYSITFNKFYELRYGENPHQKAAAYKLPITTSNNILTAKIHQGKKLSYNNIMDADGALACLAEFSEPACVVVKHANPCGVATGTDIAEIYNRAFNADAQSAFGGIIALNSTCTAAVAEAIAKVFVEIVLAPDFEPAALEILARKKNLRVLELGAIPPKVAKLQYRYVDGGLLVQETDIKTITLDDLEVVTEIKPNAMEIETMLFGWKVLKHVKSNGILIAKDYTTAGIGAGQVSRVDAVDIAIRKSGARAAGGILASDAFFPFRDSIDKIAPSGIRAIIQPGGSIRDKEVIEACNEHGIAMVFTGSRCFKH
ncbi:MAG: bifunctional phosphoribosylaminoimidazolecarboxamide formyltransferase/IMP cyclohydrolase [Candidatus Marinimicrobia bacterium]|nr:bifunctional phosphoribosylaminoimidazolecarboxamide formyltransferase/IMP cyclohydrolase [Candidatus Neomarinimicrobiota bacterium]